MRFGIAELLIVFAVLLLFFGASRLPTLGSSLGSAIKNFKRGFSGSDDDDKDEPKKPDALASPRGSPPQEGTVDSKVASKPKQS